MLKKALVNFGMLDYCILKHKLKFATRTQENLIAFLVKEFVKGFYSLVLL